MTNKQRLNAIRRARRNLRLADGFDPEGGHYRAVLRALDALEKEVLEDAKPGRPWADIGPVTKGGESLLDMSLTHASHGLPKNAAGTTLWPAVDLAWGAGTSVYAPEDVVVDTKDSSASPGEALYLTGESGARHWVAHLDRDYPLGKRFKKGALIGKTIPTNIGGGPHAHWGFNVEAFLGKGRALKYGRNGDGPDYTLGAPTIREQLRG